MLPKELIYRASEANYERSAIFVFSHKLEESEMKSSKISSVLLMGALIAGMAFMPVAGTAVSAMDDRVTVSVDLDPGKGSASGAQNRREVKERQVVPECIPFLSKSPNCHIWTS